MAPTLKMAGHEKNYLHTTYVLMVKWENVFMEKQENYLAG